MIACPLPMLAASSHNKSPVETGLTTVDSV